MDNSIRVTIISILALIGCVPSLRAADVTLVKDGHARAVIVVAADVMAADQKAATDQEKGRRLVRESVKDLALYLGKMSGAPIEIVSEEPAKGRVPILIGELAEKKFGPVKETAGYRQGFRFVVSPQGVGLFGESALATSYAIYEVLDRLGCRWYMPSELGEVIPQKKTLALPAGDEALAPGTLYRGIWYGDEVFKRRTRSGGLQLAAGHTLERYISKPDLEAHPEWQAVVKGKRTKERLCWANPEVVAAVADSIIAKLDKAYVPSLSLSPGDGADFCECEKCQALDAGDWDPSLGVMSITDRYIHFCNRIADRVTKKYPDVLFGFLAYVQYTRPPTREKLHPNLVPQIAPITYCRAHTLLQTRECPSRPQIKRIVEGWSKLAKHVSYYNYMFHLAEVSVPYPMIRQMSEELPVLYANGVDLWQPETFPNFEEVLPGMALAMRLSWNPKLKPAAVLAEFYRDFYGAAAKPMRQYWETFDGAWTDVPEHAGGPFGYLRRFTPEMMKRARATMDAARAACKTDVERQRVGMQDEALQQFELFMKLRWDLAAGQFANLGRDAGQWYDTQKALGEKYAAQFAFDKAKWSKHGNAACSYFTNPLRRTYDDATRIVTNFHVVAPAIQEWRYAVDRTTNGMALGWAQTGFADSSWKTTTPIMDTWFALGLENYYGAVFYRATVKVPELPAEKKVFLWVSATDGTAQVFVNGQPIPFVTDKGEKKDVSSGFGQPASFDITSVVRAKATNQITIIGAHPFMNELGTGGLLGPVVLYREK